MSTTILEHLYRISLEEPRRWGMWLGVPVESLQFLDTRIDLLQSYIRGLREAVHLCGAESSDWDAFCDWLVLRGEFPCEGWARKLLREASENHIRAIGRFWQLLHSYVLTTRPDWVLRLNAAPLPSQICNIDGPLLPDVRITKHVRTLARSAERPRVAGTKKKTISKTGMKHTRHRES